MDKKKIDLSLLIAITLTIITSVTFIGSIIVSFDHNEEIHETIYESVRYEAPHVVDLVQVDHPTIEAELMIETAAEPYTEVPIVEVDETAADSQTLLAESYGNDVIESGNVTLVRKELPSYYYGDQYNWTNMQSLMRYTTITAKWSDAYKVCYGEGAYTDANGFRRKHTDSSSQFTIDKRDDYIIALGTYYKTRGICGERFLIVTTTGAYTAITGDEKKESECDKHHMFHPAVDGSNNVSVLEFVVGSRDEVGKDYRNMGMVGRMGSAHYSENIIPFQGEVLYIYKIEETMQA